MSSPTFFTVNADMLAIVGAAGTPATVPIRGKVTFTPMIKSGDALVVPTLSPRPGLVSPQPVTGVIGSDGQLGFGGSVGVRLIADTSVLGLTSPLFYTVSFAGLTVNGVATTLSPFDFQAAQADTPINLVTVARVPGQPASGVVNTPLPDRVRLNGSNQVVFSANGVDLPDPLPIEGYDTDLASIAALTPADGDVIQRVSGSWLNRTIAQLKTALALVKGDVGLGNVDNVSEATILSAAASASKSADTVVDGTTNKVLSATDKTRLAGTSGTNTGDQTSVSGNAGTATQLATPRNINGVAFDGTANITVADGTKLATSAVVDNADGTIAVGSVTGSEPLTAATAIVTASTAPAVGKITLYNATSGNLTPSLPALSGLAAGARLAVRRDPAEVSSNTVTFSTNGADTFYSSGATSFTLPLMGEQREFQVISVSATKYWAPAGSLNPVSGLGRVFGAQNRGNIAVWFGDSIGTAQDMIVGSANLVDPTIRSVSTFTYASILSGQRLRYFRNCSKGGDNAATAMARWTTDVAPYQFSALIWALGTNDSFLQTTVANYAALVKEAHARTRAKGADFIICTIPPNDNLSGNPANRKQLIVQYNQFLRDYAALHGLILIDMFDLLADTSGNYASGYSTDKTHPIAQGYYDMGQLVADTLCSGNFVPPFSAPLPRTTTDANLVAEPLFLGGLNGSGVPASWSMPSGVLRTGVTSSLVTTPEAKGNWFKMVVANTFSGPQTLFQTISSGITAGRTYRLIGRIKQIAPVTITITGRVAYDANFDYTGDGTNTHEFRCMSGLAHPIPNGVFWFDSVAPTSASTAQLNFQIVGNGGTGEIHFAQIGFYDITDNLGALS